ncbi:MAG: maltose O-acetyltransferase [Ascidiaceihabitans sp.]|jgi:maltose O-acetyltransferase
MTSEREKMAAGEWYCCVDDELAELRAKAAHGVFTHNGAHPKKRGDLAPALAAVLGSVGCDCRVEVQFHCAYGFNLHLADLVYMNVGCTILDTAAVRIGARTMFGPYVQIYTAQHHKDREKRAAGLEIALPVTIGADVWIGGGAIIMPGVTIGDAAIVGAGSVVTRDVHAGVTVVGNPARVLG